MTRGTTLSLPQRLHLGSNLGGQKEKASTFLTVPTDGDDGSLHMIEVLSKQSLI